MQIDNVNVVFTNESTDELTVQITAELQKKLSSMFKDFVEILDQHKINYFTAGGTLLGAVRHKGFIPWDDDIDISIPRQQYDAFVSNAHKILPSYYKLETHLSNDLFPFQYAKLYDTRTTLIANFTQPSIRGIYMDVFPLDGISSDPKTQKLNVKKMRFYLKIYRRIYTIKAHSPYILRRLGHYILAPIAKLIYSKKSILKKIDDLARMVSWDSAEYVVIYFGAWKTKEIHKKSWYDQRAKLSFNDFQIWAPKDYDKALKCLYGDYMQLPPVEKRKSHHKFKYINLDLPYDEYINSNQTS